MLIPEEDSDEEWARIADAVNVFEAQYIAARSTAPHNTSIDNAIPTANAQPSSATTPVPPSPATSLAPGAPSLQPHIQPSAQPFSNPIVNHIPIHAQATPPSSAHGDPTQSGRPASAGTPGQSARPVPLPESDPFSQALAAKDAELEALRKERQGEQANFRNKIRTLQNELFAARRLPPAPPQEVGAISAERDRLRAELADIRAEANRVKENLSLTEQELSSARDRERKHLATLRARPSSAPVSREHIPSQAPIGNVSNAHVPFLTQPGDVVECTQAPRPPSRRRRRPSQRPTSGISSAQPAPKELEPSPQRGAPSSSRQTSTEKRPRESRIADPPHGWALTLNRDDVATAALRDRLFGHTAGADLLALAGASAGGALRSALFAALADDTHWPALLAPLAEAMSAAPRPALRAAAALLTFSTGARVAAASMSPDVVTPSLEGVARAVRDDDDGTAMTCLRILAGALAGVSEVDVMEGEENGGVRLRAAVLASDAVADCAGRADGSGMVSMFARDVLEEAAGLVLDAEKAGDAEWAGVERAATLAANAFALGMTKRPGLLTRAAVAAPYLLTGHAAGALCAGVARDVQWLREVRNGDGDGGHESGDAVEQERVIEAVGRVRAATATFTMAASGVGGKMAVATAERAAGLAAFGELGWENGKDDERAWSRKLTEPLRTERFAEECKRAWWVLAGMDHGRSEM